MHSFKRAGLRVQVDVGVKHNPALVPGAPTSRYLMRQQALAHFWGGLGVAALACAGHALDAACRHFAGMPFGAVNMLLLTGFITTAYRQVCSPHANLLPSPPRPLPHCVVHKM